MAIYVPIEKERMVFKQMTQKPVLEFLEKTFAEKKLDRSWIDRALQSAKDSEKE